MDPNANLTEMLRLAERFTEDDYEGDASEAAYQVNAERLAELVLALDEIVRGGFLPERWRAGGAR